MSSEGINQSQQPPAPQSGQYQYPPPPPPNTQTPVPPPNNYTQPPPPDHYQQPSTQPVPKPKNNNLWIMIISVIVVVALVIVYLLMPLTSPINTISDADGDGFSDSLDAFPNDPTEWDDSDGDGYGNNEDEFPNDPGEWDDLDNDGYGDNDDDEFPNDSSEWNDSDSDGVGDNDDFYDSGNGKIKISITKYDGDGTADVFDASDVYFKIYVDTNLDGIYESSYTTPTHTNSEYFTNSPNDVLVVDIGDNVDQIKFMIEVYDYDSLSGADSIDYNPGSGYWYSHTVNDPYSSNWSYNGATDLVPNEIDCLLEYKIEVVG